MAYVVCLRVSSLVGYIMQMQKLNVIAFMEVKVDPGHSLTSQLNLIYSCVVLFFYYIIILPPFGFQRGYGMTERSDFILT